MNNGIHALLPQKCFQSIRLAQINDAKETLRNCVSMASRQIVSDYDRVTFFLKEVSRVRADVTGSASDENFSQAPSSVTNASVRRPAPRARLRGTR